MPIPRTIDYPTVLRSHGPVYAWQSRATHSCLPANVAASPTQTPQEAVARGSPGGTALSMRGIPIGPSFLICPMGRGEGCTLFVVIP